MEEEYKEAFSSVMKELLNYNLYWFGKVIGTDNWIMYKSCYYDYCIRKDVPNHYCWGGGRYAN
jgi:hypothetical protein